MSVIKIDTGTADRFPVWPSATKLNLISIKKELLLVKHNF